MKYKFGFVLLLFFLFLNHKLLAANTSSEDIHWFLLIIGLLGGLSLFLYGMAKMSDGMKKSAGNKMRSILATLTNNRFVGLAVGAFVTMVIQSSSATTVMLVSFVQAGLINFTQSLGVILGANIGTTFTAQLIAFKLTDYALLMVVIGFACTVFAKNEHLKHTGNAILGFGLLFFGMKLMSDAMYPLRSYPAFINALKGLENPLISVLAGTLITALIQSSSAFTGIVIVLAQQNLITLEAGIPLILGANIGTCFTAGLATIGTSREAKRVAIAHIFFNLGGVLLFIFWIPGFAGFIRGFTELFGSGIARQIANAHTIFNVGIGLVFLPLSGLFSKLILFILPVKEDTPDIRTVTHHLDQKVINIPEMAIELARSEVYRMAVITGRMASAVIKPFFTEGKLRDEKYEEISLTEGIEIRGEKVDYLQNEVVNYLIKIGRTGLTDAQSKESYGLISIAHDLNNISYIIVGDIIPLIAEKHSLNAVFSEEGKHELLEFHEKMCKQISRVRNALEQLDFQKADKIISKEDKYESLEAQFRLQHIQRLYENKKESVQTHQLHMELMGHLIEINVYCGKIADTIRQASMPYKMQDNNNI